MCGDFLGLAGFNVDLESDSGPDGQGGFCDLGGGFANLSAITATDCPTFWSPYVEGMEGLETHGMLVRDAAQTTTYRMFIIDNAHPQMHFTYAPIAR